MLYKPTQDIGCSWWASSAQFGQNPLNSPNIKTADRWSEELQSSPYNAMFHWETLGPGIYFEYCFGTYLTHNISADQGMRRQICSGLPQQDFSVPLKYIAFIAVMAWNERCSSTYTSSEGERTAVANSSPSAVDLGAA